MKAGTPSRTAEYVALFRAIESRRPSAERLFSDPLASRFLGSPLRLAAAASAIPFAGRLVPRYIDSRYPGPRLSAVVRTRLIDDATRRAISEGAEQLVIIGAGYDTRAYRLPELAGVPVFELDHPSTQAAKRRVIEKLEGGLPANVHLAPVDLVTDSLAGALTGAGVRSDLRTIFIWEGVLSYLTRDAVDDTLAAIAAGSAGGSVLIFTYVDAKALDEAGSLPGKEAWLRAVARADEPFRLGLEPERELPELLHRHGLGLTDDVDTSTAAAGFGLSTPRERFPAIYRVAQAEVV